MKIMNKAVVLNLKLNSFTSGAEHCSSIYLGKESYHRKCQTAFLMCKTLLCFSCQFDWKIQQWTSANAKQSFSKCLRNSNWRKQGPSQWRSTGCLPTVSSLSASTTAVLLTISRFLSPLDLCSSQWAAPIGLSTASQQQGCSREEVFQRPWACATVPEGHLQPARSGKWEEGAEDLPLC